MKIALNYFPHDFEAQTKPKHIVSIFPCSWDARIKTAKCGDWRRNDADLGSMVDFEFHNSIDFVLTDYAEFEQMNQIIKPIYRRRASGW